MICSCYEFYAGVYVDVFLAFCIILSRKLIDFTIPVLIRSEYVFFYWIYFLCSVNIVVWCNKSVSNYIVFWIFIYITIHFFSSSNCPFKFIKRIAWIPIIVNTFIMYSTICA